MAHLYGRNYTRQQLQAYTGDISQIARVKPYRLVEGLEDGVLAVDVTTGSGFDFTVLPSRGMDISSANFSGRSLAWRSSTSDTHPAFFDHEGENGRGWLRGFFGGLVTTCGLTYVGAAGEDEGRSYGLHGRIGNIPATNVSWDTEWVGDDLVLTVRGKLRETTVFGENISLTRTITTALGAKCLRITDSVENLSYQRCEHMLLYHVNAGFPAVNDSAKLIAPTIRATPRDEEAKRGFDTYRQFHSPSAGFKEQVYLHEMAVSADGTVTTAVVDPTVESGSSTGFGVYTKYRAAELPCFIEWKMMDSGAYAVGMEPANCLVNGRASERARGSLKYLEPGEVREYSVEIGVVSGAAEITALERLCDEAVALRSERS